MPLKCLIWLFYKFANHKGEHKGDKGGIQSTRTQTQKTVLNVNLKDFWKI